VTASASPAAAGRPQLAASNPSMKADDTHHRIGTTQSIAVLIRADRRGLGWPL
jgi:hypothetical protein